MGRNKGGTNRKHSFEEKLRLCRRHYEEHISLNELAVEEKISFGNLGRRMIQYREQGEEGLKPKRRSAVQKDIRKQRGMSEVELLKLENLKLRVEVERLKKGYTVKGVGSKKVYVTLDGKIIK